MTDTDRPTYFTQVCKIEHAQKDHILRRDSIRVLSGSPPGGLVNCRKMILPDRFNCRSDTILKMCKGHERSGADTYAPTFDLEMIISSSTSDEQSIDGDLRSCGDQGGLSMPNFA